MSFATVAVTSCFGLSADVQNNVFFVDEQRVVYPAGTSIVIYHLDQRKQQFITNSENTQGFSTMCISPNKRFLAAAEKGHKPSIAIYDLQTLRKKKVFIFWVLPLARKWSHCAILVALQNIFIIISLKIFLKAFPF